MNGVEWWLTYDDEDHLDEIYSDAALTTQIAGYDYDVDGFLTAKTVGSDVTTYDYASTGELLEVVLPDAREITYGHDALGRRVAKAVDGVVVEKYLWAGMNQGLLAVYDGSDNLVLRFEYAGGRLPVAMTYSGDSYYLAYDQVGALRAIFDEIGSKVHEITYDSFGNILSESGTFAGSVPLGFAGGLHDSDTGLVRFGYRDYDPEVGRWTAKDPIGFAGGDVNLYGYVLNNPSRGIDPSGLLMDMLDNGLGGGSNVSKKYVCEIWSGIKSGEISYSDWKDRINTGGQWDFVYQAGTIQGIPLDPTTREYYDYMGNFMFGATASAWGYPWEVPAGFSAVTEFFGNLSNGRLGERMAHEWTVDQRGIFDGVNAAEGWDAISRQNWDNFIAGGPMSPDACDCP